MNQQSSTNEEELLRQIAELQAQLQQERARRVEGSQINDEVEAGGDFTGRDKTTLVYVAQLVWGRSAADEREEAIARATIKYLRGVRAACNYLPLKPLGSEGEGDPLTLEQVYIELDTTTVLKDEKEARHSLPAREERRLPALAAATRHPRLALLGDPGSGKSSFAKQLAGLLARAALQEGDPPPGWSPLIPLFVRLRDLGPVLARTELSPSQTKQEQQLAGIALAHWQESAPPELTAEIEEWLESGRVFLVFDGLDELPQATRPLAVKAVQATLKRFGNCQRALITCRIRSYSGANQADGFHQETLAPFSAEKISQFAQAWYEQQAGLPPDDVQKRIADLQEAATSDDLMSMAENPMLLTTIAIIHQKNHRLPKQRVLVYDEAVKILARRWQQEKETPVVPRLQAVLDDPARLRRILEKIAYEAHSKQAAVDQRAQKAMDLERKDLVHLLEELPEVGDLALAGDFLDYIDQQSGLLSGYGEEAGDARRKPAYYAFPHRTFQEYLAGCHLFSLPGWQRAFLERLEENDYWYLAEQLGVEQLVYLNVQVGRRQALELAYALCEVAEPQTPAHWRRALLSGHTALLLGRAYVEADTTRQDGGQAYWRRLKQRLALALAAPLPALERAEAGRHLARLGDVRPEALTLAGMLFCYVPPGPFTMGSEEISEDERPAHEVEIPYGYWLGQYPVSNAQFAEFTQAGGYLDERWWAEAQQAGFWHAGQGFKGRWDVEFRQGSYWFSEQSALPNQPAVGVSWYEALAFARWLTGQWSEMLARMGQAWRVDLPSEAEWEKGARGGHKLPATPYRPQTIAGVSQAAAAAIELARPNRGRVFPWGESAAQDRADSDKANYRQTGIGAASAVGCFPAGAGPYGNQEMAGNVWEWTRSLYRAYDHQQLVTKGEVVWRSDVYGYPYDAGDGRENIAAGDEWTRVVRGGSWYNDDDALRCAYRPGHHPALGGDRGGFRVCVRPHFP